MPVKSGSIWNISENFYLYLHSTKKAKKCFVILGIQELLLITISNTSVVFLTGQIFYK